MVRRRRRSIRIGVLAAAVALAPAIGCAVHAQTQPSATTESPTITRAVGAIKSVQADSIVVATDSGGEVAATLAGSTKILRVPPGQKDLKSATALQAQDLQPGDRVLVRGTASADGHSIVALAVIVMKQADVSAKQQHDREDWQKRGVGGLVSAVDTGSGTVTISSSGFGGNRNIVIHTSKDTILRRYAPGSIKFDEAKPAPIDQIKVGDQLRARGARSADGNELTAEEIVSGTFRNIAGTITAIDAEAQTLTIQDAIAKSTVVVKISPDSQMKKLPPQMAQGIAMRLKGGTGDNANPGAAAPGARPVSAGPPAGTGAPSGRPAWGGPSGAGWGQSSPGPGGPGERGNGPPDFQRFLSRLPSSTLADLQKGDAVMIVSAAGDPGNVKAITVLAGVEPILRAAPGQANMLSPWSLGGGSSAEGETSP